MSKLHYRFCLCLISLWYFGMVLYLGEGRGALVHSAPLQSDNQNGSILEKDDNGNGEPVWSHGESYAFANATGDGAVLETDSWTSVDNHGGLQVNNVLSNGTVVGYNVSGTTDCSQESYAYATGSLSANALAYGLCNSSVALDQPVSNTGHGYERQDTASTT